MDRRRALEDRRSRLSPAQREALAARLRGADGDAGRGQVISRRPGGGDAPLSYSQQRLWVLAQLEPESAAYHEQVVVRLKGKLCADALERGLAEIVRRHEVLRTTFPVVQGVPVQRIGPPVLPLLTCRRAPAETAADHRGALEEAARAQARTPFDLQSGPLWRAFLLELGAGEHALIFTVHHIVYDGWSLGVLVRELAVLYPAFASGRPSPLEELSIQFADFAAWQREQQNTSWQAEVGYWKEQLRGLAPLPLPTDGARQPRQTFCGRTIQQTLSPALSARLKALSLRWGVTPFATLLAGWKTLLHRYTGQTDIAVGSPVANRHPWQTEPLIGFFINSVVLRSDLSGAPSFRELVGRVQETTLSALAHATLPFERLISELALERDRSRNPLFDVMFILQNAPVPAVRLPGLDLELLEVDRGAAKLDLTLSVTERQAGFSLSLEHNTDLFLPATAARMLGHFATLLEEASEQPDRSIATLRMLGKDEQAELHSRGKGRARPGVPLLVHQQFVAQARSRPEATAVTFVDRSLSYRQLDERTNQLAHRLRLLGAGPEVRVGICLPRSLDLLVATLAVLKSGAAYVPLDPSLPALRLRTMLDDSGAALWIGRNGGPPLLREAAARHLDLDEEEGLLSGLDRGPPAEGVSAENLAYLIYTSGSTGTPKAVAVPHGALANFLASMRERPGLTSDDTVLALTTLSFDISCLELFLPLVSGARILLTPDGLAGDGAALKRTLEASDVTLVQATPSTWRLLLVAGFSGSRSLRILCGGEAVTADLARQLLPRCRELWNVYGPTEATVWAALSRVRSAEEAALLDTPVDNTELHVLDEHLQLLPVGVPGELHIGGQALARGYHGRPELTAGRFIPDPFSPGQRLYKTGDRARRLADGRIEILGRIDHQVKLRGHRVELGEIEAVLAQHPDLAQVAVVVKEVGPEDARLIAYLVPRDARTPPASPGPSEEAWLAFARERLPGYMVPQIFVTLGQLPLTVAGKVDRRALPDPGPGPAAAPRRPPRDRDEELLTGLFGEVLGSEPPGIDQDFFRSGGHSLLAVRLIARFYQLFGIELPLGTFLQEPTVAGVASALRQLREARPPEEDLSSHLPDLQAEAHLSQEVAATLPPRAALPIARHILLTGATGFLGPFLLAELLRSSDARIHCLVRAGSEQQGRARLQRNLAAQGLTDIDPTRLRIVLGDLALPGLGLSEETLSELAAQMDAIIHNGAQVNYLYPYHALKASNVDATECLLGLAARTRVKPLHFVSTINVLYRFPPPDHDIVWFEEDIPPATHLSTDGYVQSKWVAEQRVLEARRRGLPAFIYRPNTVAGHSRTGAWNTQALACRVLRACVALGAAPDLTVPFNLTPVDYVAQALVHLALHARPPRAAFHLVNPQPAPWSDLVRWLGDAGYPLELLPYETWRKAALAHVPGLPPHALLVEQRFDCRNTETGLAGTAIRCPPIDGGLIAAYCRWLVDQGALTPPDRASLGHPPT
jgi:myxalamid-type nonribosomal peptide synthetase MxaA